ncbi:MAG: glycosyltransferase family 4 protein [Bacteroidota bacterium]|nr:glycosyltransferase family 4 protein [Bacteroidota bacterium]MDP4228911.1 glycosyltransferase family 4 protein [Bacteroidota bacterium]MDP4236101.1 glycosyltransferase family 4 protein [Bacteroidota bacterium]
MRILQLASRLPYPLTDGGAIGIFKPTEAIAKLGHEITFVTFPDVDPNITNIATKKFSEFCRLELVGRPLPSRTATLLRTMFSGAYPIERRMMPEMFELLEKLLTQNTYDIVHLDASHMGKYGLWIKERFGLPVLLRQHNFETQIYERFAKNAKNPLAAIVAKIHARRLRVEESKFLQGLDCIVAISAEDERLMRELAPRTKFRIVPAGVDTSYFTPQPIELEEDTVLWVGGMDWDPNKDAVEFFAKEIYPLIVERLPHTTFSIVGAGTESLTSLNVQHSGRIRLHGRVKDIRSELAKAKVMICPLRVGGGMRLKLLDFFAAGKAVVSTHIGAEGNVGADGVHLLLRDDPRSFGEAVISLLEDDSLRRSLGENARALAEQTYSWQSIARQFSTIYEEVAASR